jgi:hypothetical protein
LKILEIAVRLWQVSVGVTPIAFMELPHCLEDEVWYLLAKLLTAFIERAAVGEYK